MMNCKEGGVSNGKEEEMEEVQTQTAVAEGGSALNAIVPAHLQFEKLQNASTNPDKCAECLRREGDLAVVYDHNNFLQLKLNILGAEKENVQTEVAKLRRDLADKEEVISCLLRKNFEKAELEREMQALSLSRGLQERQLHLAHMRQQHLLEMDAFERQMKAKDERLEVFRHRLLTMDAQLQQLKAERENLIQSLQNAEAEKEKLQNLLGQKDLKAASSTRDLHANGLDYSASEAESKSPVSCLSGNDSKSKGLDENGQREEKTNQHVICLVEQAAHHAFSPRLVKKISGTLSDEVPTVVDKHVSEACRAGTSDRAKARSVESANDAAAKSSVENCAELKVGREDLVSEIAEKSPVKAWIFKGKGKCQDKGKTILAVDADKGTLKEFQMGIPTVPERQKVDLIKSRLRESKDSLPLSYDVAFYMKDMLEGKLSPCQKNVDADTISKIKGIEQQLLQLEKMHTVDASDSLGHIKKPAVNRKFSRSSLSSVHLLKKQIKRYQSIVGKINDLCEKIDGEISVHSDEGTAASKEQTATRESQLMESYQLQRYLIATGQKLVAVKAELTDEVYMVHPLDSIQNHLKEIQRSLEVRTARIIGNLEGILARDGIMHVRN